MNNSKRIFYASLLLFISLHAITQNEKTVVPAPQQLAAQNLEFYLFAHFGPNTFTGMEWGHGNEKEEVFAPRKLDCRQWARIAKAAGAKGIIITAKHHDGFCLWPSKYSKHTIRESDWQNGKVDVLKELSQACREYGIKFGVYLSPWDRNHPKYGTAAYNDVFVNMMKEVLTNYGPVWELWWDGANGEGPNGKRQEYNWKRFRKTVQKLSPNTVVFSDVGPGLRWVGNEQGFAGETNWCMLNTKGFTPGKGAPPSDTLNTGNIFGNQWVSAECDVSIRPGWFYHSTENDKVKTPATLFNIYLKSVGRGANLLLNIPPDDNGLFAPQDSAAIVRFKQLLTENFSHNLAGKITDDGKTYTVVLHEPAIVNCVVLQENIAQGQNVVKGKISLLKKHQVVIEIPFTTIGRKRIISFPAMDADEVKVEILETKAKTVINSIEVYKIDEALVEKK